MNEKLCRLLLFVAALLAALPAAAQTTGQIVGIVRVKGGAPLEGVAIRATGPALQGERSAITGADGRYFLPVLPPGSYALEVSGPGYVGVRLEEVEVLLGRTTVADAVLSAGTLSESVTVIVEPSLVDATGADTGVVVSRQVLDRLPLVTRDYRELAKLVPSVTGTDVNMTTGRGPGSPSFRGEGQYGDNYLVDGLTGRDPTEYTPGTPIPIGAIEEVQLVADGFAPEYGQVLGGLMNVITRSGSNDFEGQASYIYTSDSLANDADPTILAQPVGSHDISPRFDVGGPMIKDRLWYFASVDGVDVATTFADSDLAGVGTLPGGTQDASGFTGFVKLTAALTSNQNLSANYTRQDVETTGLGAATAAPEARQEQDVLAERVRVNYQAIFGANTVLELKGGFSRNRTTTRPSRTDDVASWEVVSYGVFLNNAQSYGETRQERIDLAAVVSHVWNPGGRLGSHQWKFGIEHHLPESNSGGRMTGAADDVIATGQNPIAADFGLPDSFDGGTKVQTAAVDAVGGTILTPVGLNEFRSLGAVENTHREWGVFVQDQWRKGRWAVMLGVRADSQESTNDTGAVFSKFRFGDALAPRASVAYDFSGKGSSVLKGAWGRFYDVNALAYSGFANTQGPFSLRTYQWIGAPADEDFRNHVDDGSAYDIHNPANWAFSFEQSTLIPFDYSGVKRPQGADRWLLEYDQLLPHDLALKIRYVDHESRGLIEDINSLDPATFFRFVVQNTDLKRRDYTSQEIELTGRPWRNLSLGASYVHSRSRGTDIGQFEGSGFLGNLGSTNYVGVYLDRPPSDPGFWCTFFGPGCLPPDWNPTDPRLDFNNDDRVDQVDYDLVIQNLFSGLGSTQTDDGWYGPLAYSVEDLVKVYGRLDLPDWGNVFLGWFFQWGSGYPMSRRSFVDAYGDFLGFSDTPHYEFVGDCNSFDDCEATLVTGPEEQGLSRGSVGMPSFWNLDLSIGKVWQTRRRVGIEIRADILNVFDNQTVLTIQDRSTDTYGQPLSRQAPRSMRLYGTVRF
ncbi:MAG TPA: TonB-dependent receptor [Candidatus Polarisedimenticolaceae bacterium]